MPLVDNTIDLQWQSDAILITEREINLLYEIFGPFPVHNAYTLRSGVIGLGKSRVLVANQDQLSDALAYYLNILSREQQIRVKELIAKWVKLDTKIVKFATAERVRFRVSAPEEGRTIIRQRIQVYIPIFMMNEVENLLDGTPAGTENNSILRG